MAAALLSTNNDGFVLKSGTLTTKKVVKLCELLEEEFEKEYKGGCTIRPETINDGGIYFVDYPGHKPEHYKSMSFGMRDYPLVTDDTFDEWKNEEDRVLCRDVKNKVTRLKAFYGAPLWTRKELDIVRDCLRRVKIEVVVSSKPLARQLVDKPLI